MPAKGATTSRIEAPAPEPRTVPAPAGVRLAGVTHAYPRRDGTVTALAGMSLTVAERETVAVVGPSGCGKSTLLELVCGLQRPQAGTVEAAPAVYMPQRDLLLPWSCALDNAALPLLVAGEPRRRARERARPLFAQLGLGGFETAMPHELSGGMRQRVAFLRTLLSGRPVLALDEPFASLDALTRGQAQAWLAGALLREPRTVVLVTHDVEEAVLLGDRVIAMSERPGRAVAEVPVPVPRPRRRTDPAVVERREDVLRALGAAP